MLVWHAPHSSMPNRPSRMANCTCSVPQASYPDSLARWDRSFMPTMRADTQSRDTDTYLQASRHPSMPNKTACARSPSCMCLCAQAPAHSTSAQWCLHQPNLLLPFHSWVSLYFNSNYQHAFKISYHTFTKSEANINEISYISEATCKVDLNILKFLKS